MRHIEAENHSIWGSVQNNVLDEPKLSKKLCGSALIWQHVCHLLPRDLILIHSHLQHIQSIFYVTFVSLGFTQKPADHHNLGGWGLNKLKNVHFTATFKSTARQSLYVNTYMKNGVSVKGNAVIFPARVSSTDTRRLGEFPYFRRISWYEKAAPKYLPTDDKIRKVSEELLYTFCCWYTNVIHKEGDKAFPLHIK